MKYLRFLFFILTTLGVLFAGSGFTRLDSYTGFCVEWVVVEKGDSLYTISRDYGISTNEIVAINKLSNPQRVYPGQRLCVDTGSSSGTTYYYQKTGVPPSARHDPRSKYYTPYYHPYDNAYYYPPKYGYDSKYYYYDDEWDCDEWYDHDRCYDYEKSKKYSYKDDDKYQYYYSSDCDCQSWYGKDWESHHDYECDCASYGKYEYDKDYCPYGDCPNVYYDYRGKPTIKVEDVKRDEKVTFRVFNYPYGSKFTVYMAPGDIKGGYRYHAGTFHTSKGRWMVVTAEIPEDLQGCRKIKIWTKSEEGAVKNSDWFYNKSTY